MSEHPPETRAGPSAEHESELEAGDFAYDHLDEPGPHSDGEELLVLEVHDVRADAFEITDLDLTVAEAAIGWPANEPIDIYEPDGDCVVECVYVEGLDRVWPADEWREWDTDELRDRVLSRRDVSIYHFHGMRLAPAERWGLPEHLTEDDLRAAIDENRE